MDIEKLEKLSCLKLSANDREKISESIEGVWSLLHQLENVATPEVIVQEKKPTIFVEREDIIVDITMPIAGIKAIEGKFEAPRVVRKK